MAQLIPKTVSPSFIKILKDGSKALREIKKVDPRERYVLLYPHSDAAYVGMGFKLLNTEPAERVFDDASGIVKKDLLKLCLDGPKSSLLDSLELRHLATYVTSHATMAKLAHEQPDIIQFCKAAGGFGVGFVNALVFSGAMTFKDGLELVQKQGLAMDRAAKVVPSAKIKVRVAPATRTKRVCLAAIEHCLKQGLPKEVAICSVTKQTHAHILEIAGHEEAIKYLEDEGPRLFRFVWMSRVRKSPLAFHTDLMRPASDFLKVYIEQKLQDDPDYLKDPETCSVYSGTSGYRLRSANAIKKDLINYPVKPQLVEQLIHCLFARPNTLAQPNILVLWDKYILDSLGNVNRRARESAKLFE